MISIKLLSSTLLLCIVTAINGQSGHCHSQADIAFVLDTSSSMKSHWSTLREFVADVIQRQDIGSQKIRVAMVLFNHDGVISWYLDHFRDNKEALLQAVMNLHFIGGNTNLAEALIDVRAHVFNGERGDREFVPNIAIMMTDGITNYDHDSTSAAAASLHQAAEVVAVGIGSLVEEKHLEEVASLPELVITVAQFDQLVTKLNDIVNLACPTTTTRAPTTRFPPSTKLPKASTTTRESTTRFQTSTTLKATTKIKKTLPPPTTIPTRTPIPGKTKQPPLTSPTPFSSTSQNTPVPAKTSPITKPSKTSTSPFKKPSKTSTSPFTKPSKTSTSSITKPATSTILTTPIAKKTTTTTVITTPTTVTTTPTTLTTTPTTVTTTPTTLTTITTTMTTTTPPTTTLPYANCESFTKADMVLLLDSTTSVHKRREWPKIKNFVTLLLKRLAVGQDFVRVASVQFKKSASKINWYLTNYTDNASVNKALAKLSYLSSVPPSWSTVLDPINSIILTEPLGDRRDAENIILLFADSANMEGLSTTISKDKDLLRTASIITVSFGKLTNRTVQLVESQQPYFVRFDNIGLLAGERNRSLDLVCSVLTRAYVDAQLQRVTTTTQEVFVKETKEPKLIIAVSASCAGFVLLVCCLALLIVVLKRRKGSSESVGEDAPPAYEDLDYTDPGAIGGIGFEVADVKKDGKVDMIDYDIIETHGKKDIPLKPLAEIDVIY